LQVIINAKAPVKFMEKADGEMDTMDFPLLRDIKPALP
jgi:hypothetical protein